MAKVKDPYHQGQKVSRQQLAILKAKHDRRVKRKTDAATAAATAANDPARVTEPLTPAALAAQAQATTAAEFGPKEAEIQRQRGISDQQQKNVTDWYAQYQQTLQGIQARSQADAAATQGQVAGAVSSSAALNTAEGQRVDQQAAADATARGGRVDPTLSVQAGQGGLARNALLSSFGAQLAAQGGINRDYQRNIEGAGVKQGIEQHVKESANRNQLERDAGDVATQKGAFAAKTAGDLRESERKYLLEQAAFGLNAQKAATAADPPVTKDQAADNARQTAKDKREKQKDDYQRAHKTGPYKEGGPAAETPAEARARKRDAADQKNKHGPYAPPKKPTDPNAPTAANIRTNRSHFQDAQADVRTIKRDGLPIKDASGKTVKKPLSDVTEQVRDHIASKYHLPPAIAAIVVRMATGQQIGPNLVKQAKAFGVNIKPQKATLPKGTKGTGEGSVALKAILRQFTNG